MVPRWVWVVWGLVGVVVLAGLTWPIWVLVAAAGVAIVADVLSLAPTRLVVWCVVMGVLVWAIRTAWRTPRPPTSRTP